MNIRWLIAQPLQVTSRTGTTFSIVRKGINYSYKIVFLTISFFILMRFGGKKPKYSCHNTQHLHRVKCHRCSQSIQLQSILMGILRTGWMWSTTLHIIEVLVIELSYLFSYHGLGFVDGNYTKYININPELLLLCLLFKGVWPDYFWILTSNVRFSYQKKAHVFLIISAKYQAK